MKIIKNLHSFLIYINEYSLILSQSLYDRDYLKQNSSLFFIIIDFSQTLYIIYISYKWPVCDTFIQNYFFLFDIIRRAKGCKFVMFAGNGNSVSLFSKSIFVKPRAANIGGIRLFHQDLLRENTLNALLNKILHLQM